MVEVKIFLKGSKKVIGNINFESMELLRRYFKTNSNTKYIYVVEVDGLKVKIDN